MYMQNRNRPTDIENKQTCGYQRGDGSRDDKLRVWD